IIDCEDEEVVYMAGRSLMVAPGFDFHSGNEKSCAMRWLILVSGASRIESRKTTYHCGPSSGFQWLLNEITSSGSSFFACSRSYLNTTGACVSSPGDSTNTAPFSHLKIFPVWSSFTGGK